MLSIVIFISGTALGFALFGIYSIASKHVFIPVTEEEGASGLEIANLVADFAEACGMEGEVIDGYENTEKDS